MKIGLITINDDNNIGNRLQNYATQSTVRSLSSYIETIKNTNRAGRGETLRFRVRKQLGQIWHLGPKKYYQRRRSFASFNEQILFSKKSYDSSKNNNDLNKEYDAFLVGSDQVWNPYYGWLNPIDLLCFAEPEKRIAFSASYGVSKLPEACRGIVAKELLKFKSISVREDKGKTITEELTGRKDIEVLVDPTMLLGAKEWDSVAKKPKWMKGDERYVLKYFLGGLSKNKEEAIRKTAINNNCQIIDILDKNSKFYSCGPSEFLWLEKNAQIIFTDSFHSSVFAIINEKPFMVFEREGNHEKMNSRLDTLLSTFKLNDRWFNGGEITDDKLVVDYSNTNKILKKEREKSLNFLKRALEIE